ncbi:GGDEF domain-containing protein [Streptomyces millisiae]|uniref:GGDEF domain-containing protein n=1 Tax=Streptomyces millisiae TaxID=3075542 RepID=A0ABU2LLV7_9ACTN|nr:GGDEF domain-containing protein [Streptomyces sp. DSM 44918]MDT0318557.1 GGDEF domain-containing protein [Streptomyces sp. DSM 44918]
MDPSAQSMESLSASVPLFDPTRLPLKSWCAGSREDPLTGLIAFPDFHSSLPRELAATLAAGGMAALAIGDVDGLKQHVERANATEPGSYGHLAGNKVMARLGAVTREWFHQQHFEAGCAATFGGDEVIIAAAIDDPAAFHRAVADLRNRLAAALPTGVSFALAVTADGHLPVEREGNGWKHTFTDRLLAAVDRCLFAHKAARRQEGGRGGTIAVTEPPAPAAGDVSRTLLPLPAGEETLHVLARPAPLAGRTALLLPCAGPTGLRGRRFRVTYPDLGAKTEVVVSLNGQAAVPAVSPPAGPLPLALRAIRPPTLRGVPGDLAASLERAGLAWAVLPAHEQAQMLHLITESATEAIRTARITAAVDAIATRTRSQR